MKKFKAKVYKYKVFKFSQRLNNKKMSSEGIDMKIMDDIEEEEIMIIYKGRKNQEKEKEEEEEIIEVKTKKKEFLKKFRYFKSRNKELEQQEEIFIHDKFCTSTFKAVVESLNTKFVEVGENNYEELLLISNKYEYYELSRTIEQFMKERPDLERILSSLRQEKNKEEDNEYSDDEEEGEGMRDYEEETEKNKEEMIASHLDFFLERRLLKRMNIKRLLRILNCKSRVIHNHHALFEFIKEIIHDNGNDKNKKNKYKEYYDMLFGTLDYSEMTISEIEYIINSEYYCNVFQPKHSEAAMKTIIASINKSESKVGELELKIKNLEDKIQALILNNKNDNLIRQEEEYKLTQQVQTIEERITNEMNNMKDHLKTLNQTIEDNEKELNNYQKKQDEKISIFDTKLLQNISKITQQIEGITNKINEIDKKEETNQNSQNKQEEEITHFKEEHSINISNMKKLIEEITNKINEVEEANQKENISHQKDISEIRGVIARLEQQKEQKEITKKTSIKCHPFTSEINRNTDGILCRLKKNEMNPFNHLFIASQSTNDIYNLIDPNTNDTFEIQGIGGFIEIELQEPVDITGIKIFSSYSYFPKTFDIEINDKLVQKIEETKELKGKNQSMTIDIEYKQTRKVRIINRGKNWDKHNNYIIIKRIELLSNEAKYSQGIFSTLVYESEDHDPRKCPVFMSASSNDFNAFHLIDSPKIICTDPKEHSWLQIEFTEGRAVLFGFRLKMYNEYKIRSYKIICTDNSHKPEESWTTLIEVNEGREDEHEQLEIYEFSQPSPPTKYVRLIQTGPNWGNTLNLILYHFDLFGNYLAT